MKMIFYIAVLLGGFWASARAENANDIAGHLQRGVAYSRGRSYASHWVHHRLTKPAPTTARFNPLHRQQPGQSKP